jgi:hypothetical protein
MKRRKLIFLVILGFASCGGPPVTHQPIVNPALKPPVKIITPYGNTITCRAGPGAVCVQR